MGKGNKLKRSAAKEIVTVNSGKETSEQLMDLEDELSVDGSAIGSQARDSTEGTLGLHEWDVTADAEQSISDTKRSRRERIEGLSLEEAIRLSADTERRHIYILYMYRRCLYF
jgi:hypothetical protein